MGAIFSLGDPARHFWLTRSVARSMGINLSQAMGMGRLAPEQYAHMVTECRKCAFVTECENWLARNGAGATTAPDVCANAELLQTLKN